ncbi:MAG: cupin domain-containing protein [Actinomycetota bacterium]
MDRPIETASWDDAEIQAYDPALFTGEVERRSLRGSGGPGISWVRFVDGARSNWHTHHGGQLLHVLEGEGCVVTEGAGVTELRAGLVVRTAPGIRHWHGALRGRTMTHLAVTCGDTEWPDPPERPDPIG